MSQITETTAELKSEIQKSLCLMRALGDEVRVKVHLASMEAKDEWRKLEPYLLDVERAACEFTEATRVAVADAVKRVSKLRSSLD